MTLTEAHIVIWAPDNFPLETVAEAAEVVLATRGAPSDDVYRATHLITTMRPYGM